LSCDRFCDFLIHSPVIPTRDAEREGELAMLRRGVSALPWLVVSMAVPALAGAAPNLRQQVDQHGDFALIGNTLGHECAGGTPAPMVGTVGACGNRTGDTAPDVFWRADAPAAGEAQANDTITVANARSTAVLRLPAGATVTHAYLYWAATLGAAGTDTSVVVERPGVFTQTVTAVQAYQSTYNSYQSVANVTALVQAQGAGAYRVSGVNAANLVNVDNDVHYAGWWLVTFYQLASEPTRNLALFDGLDAVSDGAPQNVTLSGFLVPNAGYDAKLAVVAFEGDNTINGDQFLFQGSALSNTLNPADNFFNGTHSTFGAAVSVSGDLPQLTGTAQSMSGMDLDVVDVRSLVTPGQTSASISATSTGDVYHLAGFVTSITTFKPDFTSSNKTAVDVNGGLLRPGDMVEYSVLVQNTGNDTSVGTVLTDELPVGVTYVPGSLSITDPNAGAKTDAPGDDQGEYDSGTRTVTVRLGNGADAVQGGTLGAGESTTVTFRVTVDASASGTIDNQAVITAAGEMGAPANDTPTDGDDTAAGVQPTPIVIEACEANGDCPLAAPYCYVDATPNVCVECLLDGHCTGLEPTCDPATHSCICVPTGAETCDGLDNDCNGAADDGFSLGSVCTSGVGACQTSGLVVCDGAGGATCSATPGASAPEQCNGIDDDCDGTPDNGNPGSGIECATGLAGVCAVGLTTCNASGAIECIPNAVPGARTETCNALDDDCDGTVDEGYGLGSACSVGLGACQASGVVICNGAGGVTCNAVAGTPTTEQCNGIDDDCDDTVDNGCPDTDSDGLTDATELRIGTDPNDADSDDDGVVDGSERSPDTDTDGDGLINALDADSDDDGLSDGTELGLDCSLAATDVTRGACIPDADHGATVTNPLVKDTDGGGVSDGSEDTNRNGALDPGETDPTSGHAADDASVVDSDGDGLSDGLEQALGSDPQDADTDDDGLLDGLEPNPALDQDGDGLISLLDTDSDDDGLKDGTEAGMACTNPATDPSAAACIPDADEGATVTGVLARDTDRGGATDGSEDANLNGRVDSGETNPVGQPGDDSSLVDTDADGLSDALEATLGTLPNDADSDDDGLPDGREPNPSEDSDHDGFINPRDPDSDGDGLFDGTEAGRDCTGAGTDASRNLCIADGDMGTTTTFLLVPDSDDGGVPDGAEDTNRDGKVDTGERDPNDPADDVPCAADGDCGVPDDGLVCDLTLATCVSGCRGSVAGSGCPAGSMCNSTDASLGHCVSQGSGGASGAGGAPGGAGAGGVPSAIAGGGAISVAGVGNSPSAGTSGAGGSAAGEPGNGGASGDSSGGEGGEPSMAGGSGEPATGGAMPETGGAPDTEGGTSAGELGGAPAPSSGGMVAVGGSIAGGAVTFGGYATSGGSEKYDPSRITALGGSCVCSVPAPGQSSRWAIMVMLAGLLFGARRRHRGHQSGSTPRG
jgi:uncharacterized repeat protein (TIGR01451 family)